MPLPDTRRPKHIDHGSIDLGPATVGVGVQPVQVIGSLRPACRTRSCDSPNH